MWQKCQKVFINYKNAKIMIFLQIGDYIFCDNLNEKSFPEDQCDVSRPTAVTKHYFSLGLQTSLQKIIHFNTSFKKKVFKYRQK